MAQFETTRKLLSSFGRYEASESSIKRRNPGTRIQSPDGLLTPSKRARGIEGARELWRNFSIVSWAIRKHLDYVSTFQFQANTGSPALNEEIEGMMAEWSRPLNCDVAGRHSLARMIRIAETRRVIDGDVFLIKTREGRLQPIESDRVRDPDMVREASTPGEDPIWIHGIRPARSGRMRSIAVHRRMLDGRYVFEREVRANNVYHLGYFDSFDQLRGVSPLMSGINTFQDALEVKDYARAKAKITQLFALAITREGSDFDDDEEVGDGYQIDFGQGPVKMELDPGDKADFLESRHPSTEFQAFLQMSLQAALKALDIPWSFYDEAYTNFFGSKAALIQYQQSARAKQADLQELLSRITGWQVSRAVQSGRLALPAGVNLDFDWIPAGVPWWDTQKEVAGDALAVENKFRCRSEIRRERFGDDWRRTMRKLKEEEDFLEELGLKTEPTEPEEPNQDDSVG